MHIIIESQWSGVARRPALPVHFNAPVGACVLSKAPNTMARMGEYRLQFCRPAAVLPFTWWCRFNLGVLCDKLHALPIPSQPVHCPEQEADGQVGQP